MVNHLLCKEIKFPSSAIQNQVDEIVNNAPEGLSPPDRMKYFRSHAACASCHVHIDFHGLALEQIGAFGELKTTYYTGDKIEAKGVVDGIRFNSSKEFSEKLAKKAAINSCFASQVYSYLSSMAHTTVHRKLTRPEEQSLLNGMTTDQVIVEMFVRMFVGGE